MSLNRSIHYLRGRESGLALVSALLMLVIITLLGVSLFLGVNLQQRAAGNSLEKNRAMEVAQSTLVAAENWLDTNSQKQVPQTCSSSSTSFRLCASPPATPADPSSWASKGGTEIDFQDMKISTAGQANAYAANPAVWITFLGHATMGPGSLYEIDAQAYGGNSNTVAVIQAVYYVGGDMRNSTPAQNLGQ